MAFTIYWTDKPSNTFLSPYQPIKQCIIIDGSQYVAGEGTVYESEIVSMKWRIKQYDFVDLGDWDESKDVYVRTQKYLGKMLEYESDDNWWNNGSTTLFAIDVSSICRQALSYDLRPCIEDSDAKRQWAIDQTTISYNTWKAFKVTAQLEFVKTDGSLGTIDVEGSSEFKCMNTILEENLIGVQHSNSATDNYWLTSWYLSAHDARYSATWQNKVKFFTDKPLVRDIREDECEYITWWGKSESDGSAYPYIRLAFFDLNGAYLTYGTVNNAIDDQGLADGTMFNNATNADYGKSRIVQSGVGTRNILAMSTSRFGTGSLPDFSNISYYTAAVHYVDPDGFTIAGDPQTQLIRFNIDRDTAPPTGFVRFHWQNRKGGIDSYTCKGSTMESLSTSSTLYEKSIYPRIATRVGSSTGNSSVFAHAIRNGYGSMTKNEYQKVSKLNVIANKTFTATTRPLNMDSARWIEDLLVSPNVWIEVEDDTNPAATENKYVPVIIKDGTTQLVDSEGLTTIQIEYTLSKPRQTHRN